MNKHINNEGFHLLKPLLTEFFIRSSKRRIVIDENGIEQKYDDPYTRQDIDERVEFAFNTVRRRQERRQHKISFEEKLTGKPTAFSPSQKDYANKKVKAIAENPDYTFAFEAARRWNLYLAHFASKLKNLDSTWGVTRIDGFIAFPKSKELEIRKLRLKKNN
jgi:hypothetical protein